MDPRPVEPESEPDSSPEGQRRRRRRDIWQLDIPLVVGLAICVGATVIEVNRATGGNWRAAIYAFEWPLIGAFVIWIWFRFRREGGSFRGIANRWRERVAQYEEEAAAQDGTARRLDSQLDPPATPSVGDDAELDAWQRYRADVRDRDRREGRS